jgi:hypothetical protein
MWTDRKHYVISGGRISRLPRLSTAPGICSKKAGYGVLCEIDVKAKPGDS